MQKRWRLTAISHLDIRHICQVMWKRDRKLALHSIFTKFGQWDNFIISQLQAIFQLFLSYPPLGRVFGKVAN